MAIFSSYAPPGTYTTEIFIPNTALAVGTARIPVFIGEGTQTFTTSNYELFRGSSPIQDDQSVNENISDQVSGFTQHFQTTFYPVTDGTGKGVVTNDPSKVQAQAVYPNGNAVPVNVVTLNGATGAFTTQEIIPPGTDLTITYNFKRGDTLVTQENETAQVPAYASLTVGTNPNSLKVGLTSPGAGGNLVTLQFIDSGIATNLTLTAVAASSGSTAVYTGTITGGTSNALANSSFVVTGFTNASNNGTFLCSASSITTLTLSNSAAVVETHAATAVNVAGGVPDAQAVLGAGTDAITINIRNSSDAIRTIANLSTIINSTSVPTLDGGYLTAPVSTNTTALTAGGATAFTGGVGQSSNTVFQVQNFPITDGTNGGVALTVPSSAISALVNGQTAVISAVNGPMGQVTLANPVPLGATLEITYYYNTWQNTFDLLPSANVAGIQLVGLGPNRSDYTQGVDYSLGVAYDAHGNVVANTINWGNNSSTVIGIDSVGDTAFSPSEVSTTLVDEKVWLRPVAGGVTNGRNTTFILQDTPTDGTGIGHATDNPALVQVYVGNNPLEAFQQHAVQVASVNGTAQQVVLYNPPAAGTNVYASYWRNTLENQQYTLTVVTPGFSGLGTYTAQDNLGRPMPLVTLTGSTVAQRGAFNATGIIYPFGFADAVTDNGSPSEVITLTFNNDGSNTTTPAVQASLVLTTAFGSTGGSITFTASQGGPDGRNVQIALNATDENPDPVVVMGNLVTIYSNWDGTANSLTTIASYFPSAETTDGGSILASGATSGTAVQTTAAQNLTGGANPVINDVTLSYTVKSSLASGGSGSVTAGGANIGYLDQTYIDQTTGFRVTIVNPADCVAYGVLSVPQSYNFEVGDTLTYTVNQTGARHVGTPGMLPAEANNQVALFGLRTSVVTTLGATAGDTMVVNTVRGSGNEPNVGEFYFVTFTTNKVASDYAIQLYTKPSDAYAAYGQPTSMANRASVAVHLAAQNGMQTFGVIQVPVVPGTNYAATATYLAALPQLKQNLPGMTRKADVVVPLSNDPVVHQALSQQLTTLATARYKGEGIGFVGYSQFTSTTQASANAVSLHNQRMIAMGNVAAGILLTNPVTGVAFEYLVDGSLIAAAMAGLNCNPANDVATTLTFMNLTGFSRLLVTYDDPTMDLMAANGLTLVLNNNGSLLIRHYKSTDPDNTLVSEPTSTTSADFVAQTFRANLTQFIGRKLVDSLVTDITVVGNSLLQGLLGSQIINGYQNLIVEQDAQDPTQVDITVTFQPIFSLLYISVTFSVQTTL